MYYQTIATEENENNANNSLTGKEIQAYVY